MKKVRGTLGRSRKVANVVSIVSGLESVSLGQVLASRLTISVIVGTTKSLEVRLFVDDGFGSLGRLAPEDRAKINGVGCVSGVNVSINTSLATTGVTISVDSKRGQTVLDIGESSLDKVEVSSRASTKPSGS